MVYDTAAGPFIFKEAALKKSLLLFAPLFILATALHSLPTFSAPPAAPAQSGWIRLMPDAQFHGWTRVAIPPNHPLSPTSQWSVETAKGVIWCAGDQGHEWLRYDQQFADFDFHVEWRFAPVAGSPHYNSGVFVRNSSDGRTWFQAQVGSASGGYWFGDRIIGGKPVRFNLSHEMKQNPVREAGKWNVYDIHCQGSTLSLKVNGTLSSVYKECNHPKGFVGLEAEGSRIEFRNLRIRKIS
jgi:hypothetical protein